MKPDMAMDDSSIDSLRRVLVLGAAGASLTPMAGCGGGSSSTAMRPVNTPVFTDLNAGSSPERSLPIIPMDLGVLDAVGNRVFSLVAQRGSSQILSGATTSTLGYSGAMLGPALRLLTGQKTTIRVQNDLGEVTTVHWHGLVVPADVDGDPHQPIPAGGRWEANFTVTNPASTCWYHPHVHGSTGRQVVNRVFGPVWHAPRQWVGLRLLNGSLSLLHDDPCHEPNHDDKKDRTPHATVSAHPATAPHAAVHHVGVLRQDATAPQHRPGTDNEREQLLH